MPRIDGIIEESLIKEVFMKMGGLRESLKGMVTEKTIIQKDTCTRTSLVAQWLRICLPLQGTRVQALVREDPTCHGATKPVRHNY